jgi:hypothetical protein
MSTSGVRTHDKDVHAFRTAFTRDQVVRWARRGWLGRLAREVEMEGALDDLYDHGSEIELAIFRAHHARTCTTASPLALGLLDHFGFEPEPLVARLRPNGDWRRWVCGPLPPPARSVVHPPWRSASVASEDGHDRETFLHGCKVARSWSDPAGALGVRLSSAGLEIGARLGVVHLRTFEGLAALTTAVPIPETIKLSCVGRPVETLFDHPVLRDRGYVIVDQFDRVPTTGDRRAAWRLVFRADPISWSVPWVVPDAVPSRRRRTAADRALRE